MKTSVELLGYYKHFKNIGLKLGLGDLSQLQPDYLFKTKYYPLMFYLLGVMKYNLVMRANWILLTIDEKLT